MVTRRDRFCSLRIDNILKLYEKDYDRPPLEVDNCPEDGNDDDVDDSNWSESSDSDLESKTTTTFIDQNTISDEVSDDEEPASIHTTSPDSDSYNGSPESVDDDVSRDTDTDTSVRAETLPPISHPMDSDFIADTDYYDPSTNGSELSEDVDSDGMLQTEVGTFKAIEKRKCEQFAALSKSGDIGFQKILTQFCLNDKTKRNSGDTEKQTQQSVWPVLTGALFGSNLAYLPYLTQNLIDSNT